MTLINHTTGRHRKPRKIPAAVIVTAAVLPILAVILGLVLHLVTIRGWGDWAIGTDTHYCGVYWPHLDFYCEVAQ